MIHESDTWSGRADDEYSPTSPLDTMLITEISNSSTDNLSKEHHQNESPMNIVLGLPVTASMFMGKRRRDAPKTQSQSLDSFFRYEGDEFQARFKRQKKRMEDWDAKGGFNILRDHNDMQVRSKAITDVEMATTFGVVPNDPLRPLQHGKRSAGASPTQHISLWNNKKNKSITSAPLDIQELDSMGSENIVHLSLAVGNS